MPLDQIIRHRTYEPEHLVLAILTVPCVIAVDIWSPFLPPAPSTRLLNAEGGFSPGF